jgi:protein-disulfide isomerase
MCDQVDEDSQREQLRTQRESTERVPEPAAEHNLLAAVRRRRLGQLTLVAAIVVVMLAVIVVATSQSNAPPRPGSTQASTIAQAISAQLADIPQSANTLGQPTAPITLTWYGDLECPFCKEFSLGALPLLITRWVRGGQLKIEYLSMETATREPKVFETQQVAALAAGMQDKMWNYIETFYHEQGEEDSGYVTERYLRGLASQIPGLNVALWDQDRYDPQLATRVLAERHTAIGAHYRGTPTFLIGRTQGRMYKLKSASLTKPTRFNKVIEYLLAR